MNTVVPGLYASAPEPLDFAPELGIRAFLLQREAGNLLIYRSAALEQEKDTIVALGGIADQYLNHWHEASPACDWVSTTFDAALHIHEGDATAAADACTVGATFSERHRLGEDFEIIPTPGHTPGATAFLWNTGQHRALFTGDTIFFGPNGLRAAVIEGVSDRATYIQSLELLRSLEFDVLVPGIAPLGQPYYAEVDRAQAERQLDTILDRVRAGQDG